MDTVHPCGNTALHLAVIDMSRDTSSIINFIISKCPRACNISHGKSGDTPLMTLITLPYDMKNINMLLNKTDINLCNNRGQTALHLAVQTDFSLYKIIMDVKPNVTVLDSKSRSVLNYAVNRMNIDILRHMLTMPVCKKLIDTPDDGGRTPLIECSRIGVPAMSTMLLEHGAYLMGKDKRGNTALHIACMFEKIEIVELLLGAGADVNCQSLSGDTCLIISVEKCNLNLINRLLVVPGINVNARNVEGRTALHFAASNPDVLKV